MAGAAHLLNHNAGVLRGTHGEQKSPVEQKGKSPMPLSHTDYMQYIPLSNDSKPVKTTSAMASQIAQQILTFHTFKKKIKKIYEYKYMHKILEWSTNAT